MVRGVNILEAVNVADFSANFFSRDELLVALMISTMGTVHHADIVHGDFTVHYRTP
jgi:hypothetical protein